MNILFLDIDGVLNSTRSYLAGAYLINQPNLEWNKPEYSYTKRITRATIDGTSCDLVNRLIRELDVKIVLSSSHRMYYSTLTEVQEYLHYLGINGDACVGVTPVLHTIRGEEIQYWLDNNVDVCRYAILDDSPDMLPSQSSFFVKTNHDLGISHSDYYRLVDIFGGSCSQYIL